MFFFVSIFANALDPMMIGASIVLTAVFARSRNHVFVVAAVVALAIAILVEVINAKTYGESVFFKYIVQRYIASLAWSMATFYGKRALQEKPEIHEQKSEEQKKNDESAS